MKSTGHKRRTISLIFLLSVVTVTATVVPGRWEKVDRLEEGSKIIVVLQAGERIEADFTGSDAVSLTLARSGQTDLVLAKTDVERVLRPAGRRHQPIWIGAAIGGGGGLAAGLAIAASFDETALAVPGLMGSALGGAGAAIGALIGRAVADQKPAEVLYSAG